MFKQLTFRSDGAFWPLSERADEPHAPRSGLAALLTAPRRLAVAAMRELKARRAMQSLASLDDRMLRDIGVERGQIEGVCRQGRDALLRSSDLHPDIVRWS